MGHTNKVILDLKTFLDLRDFKAAILENHTVVTPLGFNNGMAEIYTTDETIKELAEKNRALLRDYYEALNNKISFDRIKEMSYFELFKFKRNL